MRDSISNDILENDHEYNTSLGQGNSLGFVSGYLKIDNSKLDDKYKTGLFKENKV